MEPTELAQALLRQLDALPRQRTAPMRAVRRAFTRLIAPESPGFVLDVARAILASDRHRWIAYELVTDHPAAFRSLNREAIKEFGHGIDSWSSVDAFARSLSGPAWREGLVGIDTMRDWARSEDRWWRRAALVSTVALNVRSRGGRGDVDRTLAICGELVEDGDDMIVKALSWALRELVVHDSAAVRAFLRQHDSGLAARVKREVMNKLETGLKNP